ncbi:MAG: hypothetical protein JNL38_02260 [Myxococcales bacterium]|nr:hypothetical protein [Myxococcales bacterium]
MNTTRAFGLFTLVLLSSFAVGCAAEGSDAASSSQATTEQAELPSERFDDSVDGRERIGSPEYGIVLREMIDAPAPKVSTVAHERKSAPSAFGVEGREVLLP